MTVDQVVMCRASASPADIAATRGTISVDYATLMYRAIVVAECLGRRGVSCGDRVTLLSPRHIDGLAGVIGILLAGGVYVPISPDYPPARISYITDDSESCLTLADVACVTACQSSCPQVVIQEIFESANNTTRASELCLTVTASDAPKRPAYILYTSGSTGRPKGVVVSHSALMNTLAWMADAFRLAPGDCIPQKTPWGFTDSLWELLLPLLLGGTVHLIDDDTVRNPVGLYHELNRFGAAITQFVPPALSAFLDSVCREISSPSLPRLRWILNGGEELPRILVDRWFSVFPNVGYANSYGMTESAIYATCFFMKQPPVWGMRRIPVGRPITNAEIAIIGDSGEVLGADQVGEICVGGKSLMTCYWDQPELTAKGLIPHPKTGELVYRTGDYGYLRLDGEIAYLGRRDHQVNIRGMRVELGEVERVLAQHPFVKQAAVIVKWDGDTKSLVAFYTVHFDDPGETAVMAHLIGILPSHMVPARCIKLDAMPVTAHNKTDRARLLDAAIPARVAQRADRPVPGSIEEAIARTWAEVLRTDDFGLDDGFFASGGNSLLLIRVYANLPDYLQAILTIPDLLHYPTIRRLADRVRKTATDSPTTVEGEIETPSHHRNPAALRCLRREGPIKECKD